LRSRVKQNWAGFILLFIATSLTTAMVLSSMVLRESRNYGLPDCDGTNGCRVLLHEDFEGYNLSQPPPNWTIEAPGYGIGGIWVEENFQKDNQRLHIMSSANNRALISQNISPISPHLEISLKASIEEEMFFPEITEQLAFAVGFKTGSSGMINLLELGRSDNRTIFPFNRSYDQGFWISYRIVIDLESSSTRIYVGEEPIGNTTLPPVDPPDIQSLYLQLGSGAWYKGRFDDVYVREYTVPEGAIPALLSLAVFPACAGKWMIH